MNPIFMKGKAKRLKRNGWSGQRVWHSPAPVGEQSHGGTGSAGQTVLETLTPRPHIPSGTGLELGIGWVHESVSLKQKEHAQVFSERVRGGL